MKYLVCKVEYEYNDETYYRPESDAVNPMFVFDTPEAANKRCLELNLIWLGELAKQETRYDRGFSDYVNDFDEIFKDYKVPKEFPIDETPGKGWEASQTFLKDLPGKILALSEDKQMEVIEQLRVIGWEVREVEEG